jgi:AcrR family transcriptional regulator
MVRVAYSPDVASTIRAMSPVAGPLPIREQQRAFTTRKLIEAARQLFAEQGYLDTTVDDIACTAGASRATFYLHFKSKAELMATLIGDSEASGVETYHVLDGILADDGPQLPKRLHAWLADWLELWSGQAKAAHAVQQATMLEPEVEQRHLDHSQALIGGLERYLERVPPAEGRDARDRLLILELMTQRAFALAGRSLLPIADDRLLDILTGLWLQVLVPGEQAR